MVLRLTAEATAFIRKLRDECAVPDGDAPRLLRGPRGVTLTFTDRHDRRDQVVVADGLVVYVDTTVAAALERATIHARSEAGETILVIREARPIPQASERIH